MISLTLTDALRCAAQRCVWFEPPDDAIKQPARLAAYILAFGSFEDTNALREQLTEIDLRDLLDASPPGIFDGRSWAYWNLMVDRFVTPPLPVRALG